MSYFKKSKLAAALTVTGCVMLSGAANAVYVNADGLGQVLLYPYYTVRGDNVSLLSVVNTTDQAKVVKVRFREGRNSADVLDFNLFLSKYDVWTAAVLPTGDNGNGTGGAKLITKDTSCVSPSADEFGNTLASGIPFRTFAIGSAQYDTGNEDYANDVMRLREGYVEIIEQASIPNGSALGIDVTHKSGSATAPRKPNCNAMGEAASNGYTYMNGWRSSTAGTTPNFDRPLGGLFGAVSFVNAPIGSATGENATALDAFWASNNTGFYYQPQDNQPNLGSANPVSAVSTGSSGQNVYVTTWSGSTGLAGLRAVSAVLMRDVVYNEYAYSDDKQFSTDWVVTMPNKNKYVNRGFYYISGVPGVGPLDYVSPLPPFQRPYVQNSGACDDVGLVSFDREEGTAGGSSGSFSPIRPGARGNALCWEANVISFGNATDAAEPSRVLGSTNNLWFRGYQNGGNPVATGGAAPQGEGGWARLSFAHGLSVFNNHQLVASTANGDTNTVILDAGAPSSPASVTYNGLPVIGFAMTNYNQGPRASYGSSGSHRYFRDIR